MSSLALCIGRFQPFHIGHLKLLRHALDAADCVIVGIGSSFRARTSRNPFTCSERAHMIRGSLSESENSRLRLMPLRDYFDPVRWSEMLFAQMRQLAQKATKDSHSTIELWGYPEAPEWMNDGLFAAWSHHPTERCPTMDGTAIRRQLFEATLQQNVRGAARAENYPSTDSSNVWNLIANEVPTPVLDWLQRKTQSEWWMELANEWQTLLKMELAWKQAPFRPIFVTADAVVRCDDHVLLVRRAKHPGLGLWALPGGFVESTERVLEASIRELQEETNINLSKSQLAGSLQSYLVFDHPQRSLFGRVITHGHFFDLPDQSLPSVQAGDDASQAQWVPIDQLTELEDQFHDDHFWILDRFLGLVRPRESAEIEY